MATKTNQNIKREKRIEKKAKIDKATNRFMINLSWGIVAILGLRFVENGFLGSMAVSMPTIMKVLAAVFAVIAIGLAICGKMNVFKNTSRTFDYAVFRAMIYQVTSTPEILEDAVYNSWEEDNRWEIDRVNYVQVGDSWVR